MTKKELIEDCIECFKRFDIQAYEENGSVHVEVALDVFVQISDAEVFLRADQLKELK
jgi:hypothetical protein